jgi:hypothetical protein
LICPKCNHKTHGGELFVKKVLVSREKVDLGILIQK